MSDTTQGAAAAPAAEEVGDGGANIDSQAIADEATLKQGGDSRKSTERQADGQFPIMT